MRLDRCLCALAPLVLTACGGDATPSFVDPAPAARTDIRHVVIVVQENHTFDASFGRYCTAAPGSNPTCTAGPACCETVPDHEPGGASPLVLDDARNAAFDPDHHRDCETAEVHGGAMDQFVTGAPCSKPGNFAVAPASVMAGYYSLLPQAALADRYFQPEIGQSSANDMYFAIARHAFVDNTVTPMTAGADCNYNISIQRLMGRTVADVLLDAGFTFSVYAEGYAATLAAAAHDAGCPEIPPECPGATGIYPCIYANSDVPFQQGSGSPRRSPCFPGLKTVSSGRCRPGAPPAVASAPACHAASFRPSAGTTSPTTTRRSSRRTSRSTRSASRRRSGPARSSLGSVIASATRRPRR